MSSFWSADDLFFLEAAYESGMTLPATAYMLAKPESEVREKARELGYVESPPTAPNEREEGPGSERNDRS
jgi:hypothetical protein